MNDVLLFVVAFLFGAITVWFLEEGFPPSRYPSRYQPRYESNQPRYKSQYDSGYESRHDALDSTRSQPAYVVSAPYPLAILPRLLPPPDELLRNDTIEI